MTDYRTLLERDLDRVGPAPFSFDDVSRRHDRKRRNQRIAAGVVGIAVFVGAGWLVTGVGSFDRTQPAVTGPTVPPAPGVPDVDYVIDLDTGVMRPLPGTIIRSLGGSILSGDYALSPDGSQLAYTGLGDDGMAQIFIADIGGTDVRQVTHGPSGGTLPAWSPDGTKIAYEGSDNHPTGNGHLFVLDVATRESTALDLGRIHPEGGMFGLGDPQFTPDGSSLLYTSLESGITVVKTMQLDGGKSTILFGLDRGGMEYAFNASMSPDGSLVTFLGSQIGGPGPLRWVADTRGTERRLIDPSVYGIPCQSTPTGTWSADGSRIVCSEVSRVIVVDIATGAATPVAQGRGAIWLDDHTLLVSV
jgi:Tol biopolymer transport system component